MTKMTAPSTSKKHRSLLEDRVVNQLNIGGVHFSYEGESLQYTRPAHTYTPDAVVKKSDGSKVYLEIKGAFGYDSSKTQRKSPSEERTKYILVRDQNPGIDLRFVFKDASRKIYKGSKTSYGDWASQHGFQWSDKGIIPQHWLSEFTQ